MSETQQTDALSRTPRRYRPLWRAVLALTAVALPVAGVATTAEARPTIAQVQQRIDALEHDAERATERYNATKERLGGLKVRIAAAQVRVGRSTAQVEAAKRELGRLGAETYKAGDFSGLSLFLSDDPDAVLAQSGVVSTLGERRLAAVQRLQAQQRQLRTDAADVAAQRRKLDQALASLQADRKLIQAKLSAAKAELNRLTASQRAALQRASRAAAERSLSEAVGRKVPAGVSCGDVGVSAPSARVKKVLDYACAQLGDPYSWGADGPGSFDCSGLTQRAWAQAGVSLPHNADMQSKHGRRVSAAELQPGDLVFYHSPISHVGIYVGDKLMLHAPRSGEVVKISAVRYNSLVAAVRL